MKYIRHASAAFILFAMLVGLSVQNFSELKTNYNITTTGEHGGYNIMENLNNLNIIQGLNKTFEGIYTIKSPSSSSVGDILGALATVGIGILQLSSGILLLPIEIIGVITGFYYVPPIVSIGIFLIFINYVGYILLSAYLRGDV